MEIIKLGSGTINRLVPAWLRDSRVPKYGGLINNLFGLTDEQMARLRPNFPKSHGKPRVDDRRVLSGIIFINRNELRWCDAPKENSPFKTLHNRWKRWGELGVFARIFEGLASEAADQKTIMIGAA